MIMEHKRYIPNIPASEKPRLVIIGGGFAGLKLVRNMLNKCFQIVLLDKNNFHQFQPLLYQVATAGLEPSAISFPLRKILQRECNVHFRMAEILEISHPSKEIRTNIGYLKYDYLVLAVGTNPNYFGLANIEKKTLPMKSAADAILIRNTILENLELALLETSPEKISEYLNIVIVGGGPTGVELAGALAEMKQHIFPKDYPELDLSQMRIVLYEASGRLLESMSETASGQAYRYLRKLGVEVFLNSRITDYDGTSLKLENDNTLFAKTVIWAAGVRVNPIKGLSGEHYGRGNRLIVDRMNRIQGYRDVFAIGDVSIMETPKYPDGHPQLAQVAIQQAKNLARNLRGIFQGKPLRDFEYRDKGSLATIGRNLAVADLPYVKLKGFLAWALWSFVHLFAIFGVKNKILTFLDWSWSYFTYDPSLRLLIRHKPPVVNFQDQDQHKEVPLLNEIPSV
jgi:NADH dehydrogenase